MGAARRLYLALICLALGACVVAGTRRILPEQSATRSAARPAYTSEQEWLISEIVLAILNVSALANGRSDDGAPPTVIDLHVAQPPTLARFSVTRKNVQFSIDVTEHLWAPNAFVPMARELLSVEQASTPSATGSDLLAVLTEPTPETIQTENARLSRLLRDNLRSPALHEQAALLMGALALRENAGTLSDPRRMMCRMTAHLAIARALNPDAPTMEGRMANAVLLVLANRQRDALARLDQIDAMKGSPALAAWSRALRMRATNDWRSCPTSRQRHCSNNVKRSAPRTSDTVAKGMSEWESPIECSGW